MSDLAAEKKRAEVESDLAWRDLQGAMSSYIVGSATRNYLDGCYLDFQLAHNTERGLRHER